MSGVLMKCDNPKCSGTVSGTRYVKEQYNNMVWLFCCYVCCRDYHEATGEL